MPEPVNIARCAEHGLHGERDECFVCGAPVEQVPMVPARLTGRTAKETRRLRILDAVEDVVADGASAWDGIEAVAGMFFPGVKAEIQAELRLRGLDPLTGSPTHIRQTEEQR